MRSLIAAVTLGAVCVAGVSTDYKASFEAFKAKYGRTYSSEQEEAQRFEYFVANMNVAAVQQARNPLASFGVTPFADFSRSEMKRRHNADGHYSAEARAERAARMSTTQVSQEQMLAAGKAIDWRAKGAVTAVKNQGQCGSCWSFSTTGGIEGQWFLAGNNLTSLSEQELVSCDHIDHGCGGGLMQNAFDWLLEKKGGEIVTEESYPYVSGGGAVPSCDCCSTRKVGAKISNFTNIPKSEDAMAAWMYVNGPLSIAVDATSFETYVSGILTDCVSKQVDHGVLAVGFDDNNQPPYWIVKNSWSASWGEAGYIRIAKGSDQCLITTDPTSSVVGPHTPTHPPTSTPEPSTSFTVKTCAKPGCTKCTSVSRAQGACIASGPVSYKAMCGTDALTVYTYNTSSCTGDATITSEPINVCEVFFGKNGLNTYTMNECGGKHITTQVPTTTTTTTAAPAQTFSQKDYRSSTTCTGQEQTAAFPANKCTNMANGMSILPVCQATTVLIKEYMGQGCTGQAQQMSMPLNKCLQSQSGGSFQNDCSSAAVATNMEAKVLRKA